jgi:hypothetical protein
MVRKCLRKTAIIVFLCAVCTIATFRQLHAQAGIQGTQSQVVKWMSVNALRSWFSNFGAEGEYCRRDRSTYVAQDQIDGMCWPNEYNIRMKGVKCSKALWIGTTNFADPVSNTTYPHKVVCDGPRAVFSGTEIIGDEFSMIGKFKHPIVYVNNASASARDNDDDVDVEDKDLLPDRMIFNTFHTSIGVTVTRKVLAFSQQYHDNYYVCEYTLKNTGIIDESGQPKLNKTLTDVVFWWQYRLSFAGESYSGRGAGDWFRGPTSWGRNTINDAVGQDANHRGTPPNDFRAIFSYWGPTSTTPFGGVIPDIGYPGPNAQNVWVLAGTQFAGTVVLHADKSATDHSDDPSQPITSRRMGTDNDGQTQPSQYNQGLMDQKYAFMTAGHPAQTHAEEVGKDPVTGWPTGFSDTFGNDPGGYASAQGFGPYTLAPGDSIRIVAAEAVAGIDRDKIFEVARNWFQNNTSAFILPNGTNTSDRDVYKATWVFTGKDSLFQTFRRAIANFKGNYAIPQPPPPPDQFDVSSGGDRIRLTWSASAASWPNFNGYRIYKAEGKADTVFQKIFECDKNNAVNSYDDKQARRGFNYYYYVQTKDDGSTNPGDPSLNIPAGEPLVSSKYYTMTNAPAFLTRPAGAALTSVSNTFTFTGDGVATQFILPVSVVDSNNAVVHGVSISTNGVRQIPSTYSVVFDTLRFVKAPIGTIEVKIISPTGETSYKLSEIRIVPNPFNIRSRNIQYGENDPTTRDRLAFYNLPPVCKIKIYTENGDLVETIEHTNGSGDEYWQSITSSRQIVVSGLYIAYFEVTEDAVNDQGQVLYRKGDSVFKKFIIIR